MPYQATVIQVLIASPSDAAEERSAIPEIIHQWNATNSKTFGVVLEPVRWESHVRPEMGDRPQGVINKQISCDFLIAFFWTRIGTPTGEYISGTVEEIEEYLKMGKEVLLYVSSVPADPKVLDVDQLAQLKEYKKKKETQGIVWGYDTIPKLREFVLGHLTSTIKKLIPKYTDDSFRLQVDIDRNPFLREIVVRINTLEKVSQRCSQNSPNVKRAMAGYFWRHYLAQIHEAGIRSLFFESGSTIAYLSDTFRSCLRQGDPADKAKWHLRTNNILTYLQFILFEDATMEWFPHGVPEGRYGASFGPISRLPEVDYPINKETEIHLPRHHKSVVRDVATHLLPFDKPALLLGTASGLELEEGFVFPGPHVGSYHNKLFKRAILASPHPLVLFLDSKKISPVSIEGKFKWDLCHPVCDSIAMWEYVRSSVPLAFCIGSEKSDTLKAVVKLLEKFQFRMDDEIREQNGHFVMMMCNPVFREVFGQRVNVRRRAIDLPTNHHVLGGSPQSGLLSEPGAREQSK